MVPEFKYTYKRYFGGVKNGLVGGRGKLEWADGPYYVGEFEEGMRHGEGVIKEKDNSAVCVGHWVKDFPDGNVAMVMPDGKIYSGCVKRGQRQGMGELSSVDGLIYEGLWKDDLPSGHGTLVCTDGTYEGEFVEGKRHGKGLFKFDASLSPNAEKRDYVGQWKNGMPDEEGGTDAKKANG